MPSPFRSNYPRGDGEQDREGTSLAPRIWSPDLAVALIGIADLLIGLESTRAAIGRFPAETRLAMTAFFGTVVVGMFGLQVLLIYRRKWAMWLLFALYLLGMVGAAYQLNALQTPSALASAPFLYRALVLLYLPMRLFRVFGPAPK